MPVNLNRPLPVRTKPRPQILPPENVGANYRLLVDAYEGPATNAHLALALSRFIVSKRIGHRRGTLLFSTTNTPEGATASYYDLKRELSSRASCSKATRPVRFAVGCGCLRDTVLNNPEVA